jgi:hypothetical protein
MGVAAGRRLPPCERTSRPGVPDRSRPPACTGSRCGHRSGRTAPGGRQRRRAAGDVPQVRPASDSPVGFAADMTPRYGSSRRARAQLRARTRRASSAAWTRHPGPRATPHPSDRPARRSPASVADHRDAARPHPRHSEWGTPLELRDGQCVLTFVGYDTGSTSRTGGSPALDAATGLGIRWDENMAVEAP